MDCHKLNILCKDMTEFSEVQKLLFSIGYSWLGLMDCTDIMIMHRFPVILLCDHCKNNKLAYDDSSYEVSYYTKTGKYSRGKVILASIFFRKYKLDKLNNFNKICQV